MKRGAALWVVAVAIVTADTTYADDRVAMLAPAPLVVPTADELVCVDQSLALFEDLVFGEIGPPGRPAFDASRQAALDAAIRESERSPLASAD